MSHRTKAIENDSCCCCCASEHGHSLDARNISIDKTKLPLWATHLRQIQIFRPTPPPPPPTSINKRMRSRVNQYILSDTN